MRKKTVIFMLWLFGIGAGVVFARASFSPCTTAVCRGKTNTLYMRTGAPLLNQLNTGSNIQVTAQPILLSFHLNFAVSKLNIVSIGPQIAYTSILYEASNVKKTGNNVLAGLDAYYGWLFEKTGFLHEIHWGLGFFPYSNFSVISSSLTQLTIQNQKRELLTETLLNYSGTTSINTYISFVHYYTGRPFDRKKVGHIGLIIEGIYQNFAQKKEQSIVQFTGQTSALIPNTTSLVNYNFAMLYLGFLLGYDI